MSTYQDLLDQGYTDEQIEQIIALGSMQGKLRALENQESRADALSNTPMAKGAQVGNTYVASHPLEHLARALRMRQGTDQLQDLSGKRDQFLQQQQDARLQFLRNRGGAAPSPMSGGYNSRGFYGA